MSYVLGIDTSQDITSVAIYNKNGLVDSLTDDLKVSHSKKLIHLIDSILKKTGLSLNDIDAYGVSNGPGSFTGLRIGIATCIGFAISSKHPVIPISTLYALANIISPYSTNKLICPIIDAGRGEVYYAIYRLSMNGKLDIIAKESVSSPLDMVNYIIDTENMVCYGTGEVYEYMIKERLKERVEFIRYGRLIPLASKISELAYYSFIMKGGEDVYELTNIRLNYIRRPDVEIKNNIT